MESLTISRPIGYLISAITSTSVIITKFIRSVLLSHADLAPVNHDLSDLRLLLELIKEQPAIPESLQSQTLLVLECCGNALIHIDAVLGKYTGPEQWVTYGRTEMANCRSSIAIFREALALVLDVATLLSIRDSSEAKTIQDTIASTVEQIQSNASSVKFIDDDVHLALDFYLQEVLSYTQPSSAQTPTVKLSPVSPTSRRSKEIWARLSVISLKGQPSIQYFTNHPLPSELRGAGDNGLAQSNQHHLRRDGSDGNYEHSTPLLSTKPHFYEEPQQFDPRQSSVGYPESPVLPVNERHLSTEAVRTSSWLVHRMQPGSYSFQSEPLHQGLTFQQRLFQSHQRSKSGAPSTALFSQLSRETLASSSAPSAHTGEFDADAPKASSISRGSILQTPVTAYYPTRSASSTASLSFVVQTPMSPQLSARAADYSLTPTPLESGRALPIYTVSTIGNFLSGTGHLDQLTLFDPTAASPHQFRIQLVPVRHLVDKAKGKGNEVVHIDTSPLAGFLVTKHANKQVKIWSLSKNIVHDTVKITSYVQPRLRSREYFVRGHAVLSEAASLIGISTHFGITLEIYNFAKGSISSRKPVQVIEEAYRWASASRDALHINYAPLAVYRPKLDRIDRYFLSYHPGGRQIFVEDPNQSIEFLKAGLPFVPKFPDLAYNSDPPMLVAAAGPRPGDHPRTYTTILIAWHMRPKSAAHRIHGPSPYHSATLTDDSRHKPYRVCVPEYPALQTALPCCLVAHGDRAISVWIPARDPATVAQSASLSKHILQPSPIHSPSAPKNPHLYANNRYVLIWHLSTNTTSLFPIPLHAHACISPDCQLLAYFDATTSRAVIIDLSSVPHNPPEDVWRWPEVAKKKGFVGLGGQFANLESPNANVNHKEKGGSAATSTALSVFEFSRDGKWLVVGDAAGNVGVYEVRRVEGRVELMGDLRGL